jgi:hypothetical protein
MQVRRRFGWNDSSVGRLSLVWILSTSGTVLPNITENVRFTLLLSAGVLLLQLVLLLKGLRKRAVFAALAAYVILSMFVVTSMIANSDFASYLTYARLLMAVAMACGCGVLLDKSTGVRTFVNFVTLISGISLIFFFGDFVTRLPGLFEISILNETPYHSSLLYVELVAETSRNTAIYIEPGLFQIYLCLALLALLYSQEPSAHKRFKIAVLVAALLSTKSTAGYVAGLLIFSGLAFKYNASRFRLLFGFLRLLLVALIIVFSVNSSYFIDNIESKFSGKTQLSWLGRKDSTLVDLELVAAAPFFGVGAGGYLKEIDAFGAVGYEIAAATNTYTQVAAVFGLPFLLSILVLQLRSLTRLRTALGVKLLLATVWAICFLSQPFVLYPFFYLPVFLSFNRAGGAVARQSIGHHEANSGQY